MGLFGNGDLNTDGLIDEKDANILIEHNGHKVPDPIQTPPEAGNNEGTGKLPPSSNPDHAFEYVYDLNQDKVIDIADLAILFVIILIRKQNQQLSMQTLLPTAVKVEAKQEAAIPQGERYFEVQLWKMLKNQLRWLLKKMLLFLK
ncbi:MAG: hypothetical protein V8R64_16810 [Thomasclavelia sp.]